MDIARCITELGITDVIFNVVDGEIVSWEGETAQPTQEELETAWVSVQAKQYQRDRVYPSINDQLDMLWHAIDAGTLDTTSDFYTTLAAVKDANPKPSE